VNGGGPRSAFGRSLGALVVLAALVLGGMGVSAAAAPGPGPGRVTVGAIPMVWGLAHGVEPTGGHPSAISCGVAGSCVVVDTAGDVVVETDGVWGAPTNVDAVALTSVSCVSTSFCLAVDSAGGALIYDGSTWTTSTVDTDELTSVSCVSATFCVAVDVAGRALAYTGGWSAPTPLGTPPLTAVSCATTAFCVAADAAGGVYTYTGSWSGAKSLGPVGLLSVACPSSAFCIAGDDGGSVHVLRAGTWTVTSVLDSGVVSVACASATSCVALGQSTKAARYTGTWAQAKYVFPTDNGVGATCVPAGGCAAVSAAGDVAELMASSWSEPSDVDTRPGNLTGVSCGTRTFCIAVDDAGEASSFNGVTWSAREPTGLASLSAVSCVSGFCIAVSDSGGATPYEHGTWGPATRINTSALTSVSCVSLKFCAAVDAANRVQTFNGVRWSAPSTEGVPQATVRGYNSVSCVAPRFCVAVDENGNELFFGRGGALLHEADVFAITPSSDDRATTATVPLTAISCATSALCVAVDEEGNEVTYTSHGGVRSWSRPGHVDPYRLTGVACTRSGFCLAVDDDGGTVVYDHGHWYPPSWTVPLAAIQAVSCVAPASCVLADTTQTAMGAARG
jgi:hypothetical protein